MSAFLPRDFLTTSRGVHLADSDGISWSFDAATNQLTASVIAGEAAAAIPDALSEAEAVGTVNAVLAVLRARGFIEE